MPTINYLGVIDCEHDAAKRNEVYWKGHRRSKRQSVKIYQCIVLLAKDISNSPNAFINQKTGALRPDVSQYSQQYDRLY